MNWLQQILQSILNLFKNSNDHGVLPTISGGDQVFTPTITMDGNWLPYASKPYETQYYSFGDALDCVSQSGVHLIECLLNYYYKNNLFPIPEMKDLIEKGGYLNDQGYIELSVPYIAKLAGTTKQGLAMDAFWNAVNQYGLVPKKNWNRDNARSWEEYYLDIPTGVKLAGQDFAKIFKWNWKVIANNDWGTPNITQTKEALTHSPIHFATVICTRNSQGIMIYCGKEVYQHARTLIGLDTEQEILDQYSPFLTKSELTYPMACSIVANLSIQ